MKKQELKSTYERAEEWCKRVVKNGDDLLFFADKFDAGMIKASLELKFPLEVILNATGLHCIESLFLHFTIIAHHF